MDHIKVRCPFFYDISVNLGLKFEFCWTFLWPLIWWVYIFSGVVGHEFRCAVPRRQGEADGDQAEAVEAVR
jgi:hypothetical protein